ncbi:hypothetical protein ACWNG8_21590 [Aeromonas veronii]
MSKLYKRLAKKHGIWRVDGIGPIAKDGRLGTRAIVYFSGLNDDGLTHPYKKTSLNGEVLAYPVHSASIKDFRVGSVWKEGKRVSIPNTIEEQYTIDTSSLQIVALNYRVKIAERLWIDTVLPESHFYMGDNRSFLSPTLYAIVPVKNDKNTQWLVTPISELVSFYAGISSRVLSSVLQGQLNNYVDWEKCKLSNDCVTLHIKAPVSRKEAFVLARIVASQHAKEALLGVHQALAITNMNNIHLPEAQKRPLIISSKFPFNDQTTLKIHGKKMPIYKNKNGADIWAIFAMEIKSCSHPCGFSKIIFEYDESSSGIRGTGQSTTLPLFNPLLEDNEEHEDYELDDLPADLRLRRLAIRNYTNPFPDFGDIYFENQYGKSYKVETDVRGGIDVPVVSFTVEDGNSSGESKGNLGVDTHDEPQTHIDRELGLFLEMLQHLRISTKKRQWNIETIGIGNSLVKNGEVITLFPEKIASCRSWHKIEMGNGASRPRQVVFTEITIGTDPIYFYLLEMELKPSETGQCTILLYNKNYSKIETETFKNLLFLTAVKNRWPSPHYSWKTYKQTQLAEAIFSQILMIRINHPSVSRDKDQDNKKEQKKKKINPTTWSQSLLDKIEDDEALGTIL